MFGTAVVLLVKKASISFASGTSGPSRGKHSYAADPDVGRLEGFGVLSALAMDVPVVPQAGEAVDPLADCHRPISAKVPNVLPGKVPSLWLILLQRIDGLFPKIVGLLFNIAFHLLGLAPCARNPFAKGFQQVAATHKNEDDYKDDQYYRTDNETRYSTIHHVPP